MKREPGNVAFAHGQTDPARPGGPPFALKPRLLLVDDEPAVLDGLALHLRRKYDIVMRTSAVAALEALTQGGVFTAVISDLKMPNMDGIQFLAEVRRRSPSTTRVLLTGYADVTSAVAAVNDAGVHCFLTKPCPPMELAAALEAALASTGSARNVTVDEQMARLGRQATLGTMAGAIGHEMGSLVASLSSSLDLVQSQVDRAELPASETLGLISLAKNRLKEHTNALLDLARPRRLQIEILDVGTIVCGAVEMLKRAGVIKAARTQIELPGTSLNIEGDRSLIEGVLVNLLKNASEALAEKAAVGAYAGGYEQVDIPVITVRVTALGEEAVAISVEDNGTGVMEENIDHLFTTYFTTKGGSGGTGFGLAIARETVEHHGGRIRVATIEGEGATFTVELPLAGCRPLEKLGANDQLRGRSLLRLVPRRG